MAAAVEKITDEQVAAAFAQVRGEVPPTEAVEEEVAPAPDEAPAKEAPKEEAKEEAAPVEAASETPSDDVESLKARLAESEKRIEEREKQAEARLAALQARHATNEHILRDRFLRKSTATDKALRVLKAAKTEAGVDQAEADRVIAELESTMHPASATYAPTPATTEDQTLVLNSFLNEKGMDYTEADRFGKWVTAEARTVLTPAEQAVANESLDGFLHIAHNRWKATEAAKLQKQTDAVAAVRSVQRVQREVARAAAPASAPKKQPTAPSDEVDVSKFTPNDISTLLRKTVESYR